MLARNLVIQNSRQPITLTPTEVDGGYKISDGSIHILYSVGLPLEGNHFSERQRNGRDMPFLASVKADELLVNTPTYSSEETPFLIWAVKRARELVDQKIRMRKWSLCLSCAGHAHYFNVSVESDGPADIHPKMLHDQNFLWEIFFSPESEIYQQIATAYKREAT